MDDNKEYDAIFSIHSWLLKTKYHTILIDTGAGNNKKRPFTPYFDQLDSPYLKNLSAASVKPEDVDYILLTHLHVDHVGWNTRYVKDQWVPTFPNATHVFSKKEYEYYTNPVNNNERNKTSFIIQKDSVEPIINAGLSEMIDVHDNEFIDGLAFISTPGHSIDHSSILLTSCGEKALFTGDILQHPIQVRYPEWNSMFNAFTEQAHLSRRWVLKYAAEQKTLLFSTHLPETSAGLIKKQGKTFDWQYI